MDENIIVPAIQFANERRFNDRYRRFDTEEQRDAYYEHLRGVTESEMMLSVRRVDLTIRVETLPEGDN
jgi:hypothetical protein